VWNRTICLPIYTLNPSQCRFHIFSHTWMRDQVVMPTKNSSSSPPTSGSAHGSIRKNPRPKSSIYRSIPLPRMGTSEENDIKSLIDREFSEFISACPSLQDSTIAGKPFLECHKKVAEKWAKACPRCGSLEHKTVRGCRRRHTSKKVTFPEEPVTETIICERWIEELATTTPTENGASSHNNESATTDNESVTNSDVQNHASQDNSISQNDNAPQDDNTDFVLDFRHWGMTLKDFPDGPVTGWLF
jgi:hypothetical protein